MNGVRRMSNKHRPRVLTVLVDMDGVLADFEGHWLSIFRQKYPNDPYIPLDDRRTFYIADQYDDREQVSEIYSTDGFYGDLPPIEGACEALKEMSSLENVDVFICSTPLVRNFSACAGEKGDWIIRHLGRDWLNKLILTVDKTVVRGDILIDDKHRISGSMLPAWEHVLFSACHNQYVDMKGRARLESWKPEHWMPMIEHYKKKYLS